MRSLYVWLGVSVVCALLGAGWLGQKVLGQPDGLPQSPPAETAPPLVPPPPSALPEGQGNFGQKDVNGGAPLPRGEEKIVIPTANYEAPAAPSPLPNPGPSTRTPSTMETVQPPSAAPGVFGNPAQVFPVPQKTMPTTTFVSTQAARPSKTESMVTAEWIGPAVAKIGQPMACQILVCNHGPMAVYEVAVRHALPEGVEHKSSDPAAAVHMEGAGRALSWNVGTLQAGEKRRLSVQLVSQNRGLLNCQATVTFSATSMLHVEVREPLLVLKVKGPESVVAGEEARFLITLYNPGDADTDNVDLKADLPEALEHRKGRCLRMGLPALAPKETRNLELVCMARGSGQHSLKVSATAEANLKASEVAVLEILEPKLDLAVTGPKLRYVERHAVYTWKVSNPGSVPASNALVTATIPAGFRFHQAMLPASTGKNDALASPPQYDNARGVLTWKVGDLMPGQTREMSLELVAAAPGEHRLAGVVTSARGARGEAETRTRVEGVSRLEVEVADTEDPVEVGAETTYKIRVHNSGTKLESNIVVVCEMPSEMQFVKARADVDHRAEGATVVFAPLPSLAPLGDYFCSVTVKGVQPGNLHFRVQVRADGLAEPIQREEVTRVYNDESPAR